jgi:hypothetical protein
MGPKVNDPRTHGQSLERGNEFIAPFLAVKWRPFERWLRTKRCQRFINISTSLKG